MKGCMPKITKRNWNWLKGLNGDTEAVKTPEEIFKNNPEEGRFLFLIAFFTKIANL